MDLLLWRIAPRAAGPAPPPQARWSQWLAAGSLALALVLLGAGAEAAGWLVAGLAGALAVVSALTGLGAGARPAA